MSGSVEQGENEMTKKWTYALSFVVLLPAALAIAGCEEKGPMEKAGAKIDGAAASARDAVGDAVDKTGEAIEEAGDKVREKTDH
jgi:predicted small lipoprotein YifL